MGRPVSNNHIYMTLEHTYLCLEPTFKGGTSSHAAQTTVNPAVDNNTILAKSQKKKDMPEFQLEFTEDNENKGVMRVTADTGEAKEALKPSDFQQSIEFSKTTIADNFEDNAILPGDELNLT